MGLASSSGRAETLLLALERASLDYAGARSVAAVLAAQMTLRAVLGQVAEYRVGMSKRDSEAVHLVPGRDG